MSHSRGLKCSSNLFNIKSIYLIWCFILIMFNINNSHLCAYAKSVEQQQQRHQLQQNATSCDNVKDFFDSINVTNNPNYNNAGDTCSGQCCDNKTEDELLLKSTQNFERIIQHHTNSHRGFWESTAKVFRDHVLELSHQSENKTLHLFAQVYRRMSPLSRQPIMELYQSIRSHISSPNYEINLETVVERFFINLFPVAYHNAVQAGQPRDGASQNANTDFNNDFKNCLTHTYDSLQPFGEIPKKLAKSLVQSVEAASVFVHALDQGAEILDGVVKLGSESLSKSCKTSLLKMNYCAVCKGHERYHARPCDAYCVNVMNGCITQYIGSLSQDWYSFSQTIEKLIELVRSQDGIENVIKGLDAKLSEAIMHAMQNGPFLQEKVKKACGTGESALVNMERSSNSYQTQTHQVSKWITPPEAQILQFRATLAKSNKFFYKISESVCENDDSQPENQNCWTGDHIGDYSHTVILPHSQKYNPEVPVTSTEMTRGSKLYALIDRLITLKNIVSKPLIAHTTKSDKEPMLGDMAEGSGGHYYNEEDQFSDTEPEYEEGSGSGDGMGTRQPPVIRVNSSNWTPTPTSDGNRISSNNNNSLLVLLTTTLTLSITFYLMTSFSRH